MARPRLLRGALAVAALLGGLVMPVLTPTPAAAATVDATSTTPVTIQSPLRFYDDTAPLQVSDGPQGTADRYPASVAVTGAIGTITSVAVAIPGLSHPRPDDLDILLVGPHGQSVVLLSDAGGSTAATDLDLVFSTDGDLPADDGPLTSGFLSPADYEPGAEFPVPAPATGSASALTVFDGTDPNGTWSLYVVDDTTGATGSLPQGWSLLLETEPSSSPYPSTIDVTGVTTPISDVDVTLTGLSHEAALDLDVVLVAPDGVAVTLMSDAGGMAAVSATVRFDDAAGADVPASNPITSSTYRPANYEDVDDYLLDPFPDASTHLSALQGHEANGSWKLYVADDSPLDEGTLAGWSLHITPLAPTPPPPPKDVTPPTGTLTLLTSRGTGETTSSRTVYISIAASEDLAGIRLSNDGEPYGPLIAAPTAPFSTPWQLTDHDGVRRVLVQLQDRAGNLSQGYISDTVALDRVAPRVQRVWPAAGTSGVRRDVVVRARFDGVVEPNSTISLGYTVRIFRVGRAKPIAAAVRLDGPSATARAVPRRPLRPDTRYKVVVSGFHDPAGNYADQDPTRYGTQLMVWRFRTR